MKKRIHFVVVLLLLSLVICLNGCEKKQEEKVYLGIDLIDENLDLFEGKKVGLITNPTGINSEFQSTIDILYEKVQLVSLFAPEHGIRGSEDAGATVGTAVDSVTKLPVYSLYGQTQSPTKEMMDTLDIMCIDIQDVGARFYTYIYTMANAMKACKEYGKKFVVFDRPNPVNGVDFEGNILDTKYSSFIGMYPIVQRHGMTIGEIALYFNTEFEIQCDLEVVKMKNWDREMYFEDTHLPWVLPSPNMPTPHTALLYSGTCIFEGTNLSEGRGTTTPFQTIGAPWINGIKWADALNELGLPGVYFRSAYFTPTTSKHQGTLCGGVEVHITDKKAFQPVKTGWAMVNVVKQLYHSHFETLSTFNLIAGYDIQTLTLDEQFELIEQGTKTFGETRKKYLLY